MSELVNVLDSEIRELQDVLRTLNDKTYRSHNLAAFEREIVERFQESGFVVDVKWYETNAEGVFAPEVEVTGRCQPLGSDGFDHDRQRHEVVTNVLGLPEADAGVIKTPETWSIEQAKEIHKHGPACGH
jgi:hypothetical protein